MKLYPPNTSGINLNLTGFGGIADYSYVTGTSPNMITPMKTQPLRTRQKANGFPFAFCGSDSD